MPGTITHNNPDDTRPEFVYSLGCCCLRVLCVLCDAGRTQQRYVVLTRAYYFLVIGGEAERADASVAKPRLNFASSSINNDSMVHIAKYSLLITRTTHNHRLQHGQLKMY